MMALTPSAFSSVHAARLLPLRAARWLAAACLLLLAGWAGAQTSVSGAIAVDTRWSAAQGPYLLSGDVVLQNGAQLTIDAGTTIYMGAGANLTVHSGVLRANGTAAQPVRVLSDKSRVGAGAAPGDWKQWVFLPGSGASRLEHVQFRHGDGLAVKGAAPVFNFLDIGAQLGAAVTVDLAASPSGVGNQAAGNGMNGIAVPAGDITGSVRWGLRGMPYVVAGGAVSVGASPAVAAIVPDTLQQGATATLALSGTRLAGLQGARFERAGLTAQVLPGGSDTQASVQVTAEAGAAVGSATLRLLADAGELRLFERITVARAQPTLSSLEPASLYAGQGTVSVILRGSSFSADSVAQVNGVAVGTQFVSANELRASVAAPASAGTLQLRLRTPDPLQAGQFLTSNALALPVVPAQIVLAPATASLVLGAQKTFTVTLPYVAGAGGAAVDLVSSVPSVAGAPASLLVPAGQSSAAFQLQANGLGSTVLTASKTGLVSGSAQVTVLPPPTLSLQPSTLILGSGRSAELTVRASQAAGPGGLAVTLASAAPTVATVPSSVTIAEGATTAVFTVSTLATGTAAISAQAPDFAAAGATVTVRPVSLLLPAGALVAPGLNRSIPLTLSDPAPEGGLVVSLASSNPAVAAVPASVTVPAGQSNVNFVLNGVAAGSASISATASGYQAGALPVTVEAVTVGIGSPAVGSISLPAESSVTFPVTLSRPAPAGGVVLTLSMADPAKATVAPATVTIAEGQTSAGVVQITVSGVAKGSTTLRADAPGLSGAALPVTVSGKVALSFNYSSVTVGKGMRNYESELTVERRTDGAGYAPNQDMVVNLQVSDASKVGVPASVTIPARYSAVYLRVTGIELSGGVTLDASAPGATAPVTKPTVKVVEPVFSFSGLDTARGPGSVRDNFYISVNVPGAIYSSSQSPAADMPIDLAIVQAAPEGIVAGFHSAETGGTALTQLILPRNSSNTPPWSYIGSPTAAGTYKVQASAAGVATSLSPLVTVSQPNLKFSVSAVVVGKGMRNYVQEVYVSRVVNGTATATSAPVVVSLSSSDPSRASVPATVTIPAGQSGVYFQVTGVDLTGAAGPVTIDASADGHAAPVAKLTATVVAPVFNFVSLDTARSPGSARDNFYISVTVPGAIYSSSQSPAANMTIDLAVVQASPAGIVPGFHTAETGGTAITQLVLPKDSNNTPPWTYVDAPVAGGSYRLQASVAGVGASLSPLVTVSQPDLKFSLAAVVVGKGMRNYSQEVYVSRVVNGTATATSAPVTVSLVSSDPARASVPATVAIPAGQSGVYFQVTGVDFTSAPVSIDAAALEHNAPAAKLAVTVVAPVWGFAALDTRRNPGSVRDNFYLNVSVPGAIYSGNQSAAADMLIDLAIAEANPAGIVAGFHSAETGGTPLTQVLLAKGATNTPPYTYVGSPQTAGSYRVQASVAGVASTQSATVAVTPGELRFSSTAIVVGKGMRNYSQEVYVYRAANGTAVAGAEALTVNLVCNSTAICNVPATVTIAAGQSGVYFRTDGVDLGNTTITASALGHSGVQDLAVSVVAPQLVFGSLSGTTVGGKSNLRAYLTVPGASYSSNQTVLAPMTVNFTSSAPGVATVPASLVVPLNDNYTAIGTLTGVAPGSSTITASGAGLLSTSSTITVTP